MTINIHRFGSTELYPLFGAVNPRGGEDNLAFLKIDMNTGDVFAETSDSPQSDLPVWGHVSTIRDMDYSPDREDEDMEIIYPTLSWRISPHKNKDELNKMFDRLTPQLEDIFLSQGSKDIYWDIQQLLEKE